MAFPPLFKRPFPGYSSLKDGSETDNEFLKTINLFTSAREKLGISLEELSNKTKISRTVLVAISNGRKEFLPEKTYLISMLKTIEIELNLGIGSLDGILPKHNNNNNYNSLSKFKIINIDFLNSWVGSFLYLICMFLSILAINRQHRYLLQLNSISTEPIVINENYMDKEKTITIQD